ncbi:MULTISPECIES: type II toxin-antitoxin system RelB family antitoxin [Neorhizobium]|jgi:RHH-type rel operon transcriptional repressor/antitoxin RelB|uniref:CopG domain protein DNA-binding domain protein n=3 Tax=Neorhizobium galegae TaxID=399 RepID=A0A068SL44_NEOGA|nr:MULTISPECIES: DUF6290 family protein [Neorhizobium]KAB1085306.1 DNA-binding protein [Neorhizobium galegae]MCQ1854705.1 DUF6290 family protein [Neorhizobium galegae]CDN46529.1 CopG domain protein DNA-binding domain protein [Neorhizobium galegae bv. orientalis str. HAMBI 540]CDZ31540.1 Hypothetical protein NGAL_HAMBI1145_03020 [Neorhizobium galegae bv. officinalis]CDZ44752.1 Hypothetical protein NGAL_HAMBI2427_08310 [Neorhizobium galegae bv. orientalis]
MNKRVTIEMPEEMHEAITEHAAKAGAKTDAYVLDLIEQHLEDLHDIALAEAAMERIRDGEPTYTLEEVKLRLGLDD